MELASVTPCVNDLGRQKEQPQTEQPSWERLLSQPTEGGRAWEADGTLSSFPENKRKREETILSALQDPIDVILQ